MTTAVVRNLTKVIASVGPIEIDTMSALAGLLGVDLAELLTP